jgi:hypothetical protein
MRTAKYSLGVSIIVIVITKCHDGFVIAYCRMPIVLSVAAVVRYRDVTAAEKEIELNYFAISGDPRSYKKVKSF